MSWSIDVLRLDRFNNRTRRLVNPVINSVKYFLEIFTEIKLMIYHCFCWWIEINWMKFNFRALYFFNKIFTVTWCLKSFVSSERSLNKSSMLVLLASNWINGSFFSTNLTLQLIAYPLNAWSVFITFSSS